MTTIDLQPQSIRQLQEDNVFLRNEITQLQQRILSLESRNVQLEQRLRQKEKRLSQVSASPSSRPPDPQTQSMFSPPTIHRSSPLLALQHVFCFLPISLQHLAHLHQRTVEVSAPQSQTSPRAMTPARFLWNLCPLLHTQSPLQNTNTIIHHVKRPPVPKAGTASPPVHQTSCSSARLHQPSVCIPTTLASTALSTMIH